MFDQPRIRLSFIDTGYRIRLIVHLPAKPHSMLPESLSRPRRHGWIPLATGVRHWHLHSCGFSWAIQGGYVDPADACPDLCNFVGLLDDRDWRVVGRTENSTTMGRWRYARMCRHQCELPPVVYIICLASHIQSPRPASSSFHRCSAGPCPDALADSRDLLLPLSR